MHDHTNCYSFNWEYKHWQWWMIQCNLDVVLRAFSTNFTQANITKPQHSSQMKKYPLSVTDCFSVFYFFSCRRMCVRAESSYAVTKLSMCITTNTPCKESAFLLWVSFCGLLDLTWFEGGAHTNKHHGERKLRLNELRFWGRRHPFVLLKSLLPPDLLPLVVITLVIGYVDHEHAYISAETKFATAITSIIPLSYFIGMGIAR